MGTAISALQVVQQIRHPAHPSMLYLLQRLDLSLRKVLQPFRHNLDGNLFPRSSINPSASEGSICGLVMLAK